ncbi:MAG: ribosome maturation factor RimP [Polyangiaceae bacterium]|nr:ribosome maturation factor RimP [Polyangiaceae bacterium]
MQIPHEKLTGLDRDALLALIEPVLRAHGVQPVELVWAGRGGDSVLSITLERPESRVSGEGITLDLCSEVSRDLSAALDVTDVIPGRYRLEVGSPGVERRLYQPADYARFTGQQAKLKLREPIEGQYTHRGALRGLDEAGNVLLHADAGELVIELSNIQSAHLVLDWQAAKPGRSVAEPQAKGRPTRNRRK